jgi:hypothetical protein
MQYAAYCISGRMVFPACSASFATITTYHYQAEDNFVYQLVSRMGMKWTMISKAPGDRTPLQVKNRWYSVLRKRELSVFDDIDMMMFRSRVHKGESITELILD